MMYAVHVPRDGYVAEKVRELGNGNAHLSKIATQCYDVNVNGVRLMLSLSCGPGFLMPAGVPHIDNPDGSVIWCTGASELEWVPANWASVPDAEGWWVRKCPLSLNTIQLL